MESKSLKISRQVPGGQKGYFSVMKQLFTQVEKSATIMSVCGAMKITKLPANMNSIHLKFMCFGMSYLDILRNCMMPQLQEDSHNSFSNKMVRLITSTWMCAITRMLTFH
jgi:hypothetical protein